MAALRQLRASEQPIAFKPWIFAIAKNACIDEFRRSSRAREVPVETDDDFPTGEAGTLSLVPTPPAAIEGKQRLQDLRGAFGGLSDSHHQLLVMRELEGRSYDEIGERLGMTKQMVESGLFRARRKLTEEYEELASGRRCEQVQTVDRRPATRARSTRSGSSSAGGSAGISPTARPAGTMPGWPASMRRCSSRAASARRSPRCCPFGGLWRWPWRKDAARLRRQGQGARGHPATRPPRPPARCRRPARQDRRSRSVRPRPPRPRWRSPVPAAASRSPTTAPRPIRRGAAVTHVRTALVHAGAGAGDHRDPRRHGGSVRLAAAAGSAAPERAAPRRPARTDRDPRHARDRRPEAGRRAGTRQESPRRSTSGGSPPTHAHGQRRHRARPPADDPRRARHDTRLRR